MFALLLFALVLPSVAAITTPPISRVAIVGSGPAGLSLAAALNTLDSQVREVVIYEAREDVLQTSLGGGVQLTGGASILNKLGLGDLLHQRAQPLKRVIARNTREDILLDLDVAGLIQQRASRELCSESGQPLCYSIMRDNLQDLLYQGSLSKDESKSIIATSVKLMNGKEVVSVKEDIDGGSVTLEMKDGSREAGFDMVFGADGVRSAIAAYVDPAYKDLRDDAFFTGFRVTYCVSGVDDDFSLRPNAEGTFLQFFGDGCYVLTASYGGLEGVQHMAAVVYRDERDSTFGGNAAWKSEAGEGKRSLKEATINRVRTAGLFGRYPEIERLLEDCAPDSLIDLGVRGKSLMTAIQNPLDVLQSALGVKGVWGSNSGRVVLTGDSAHAMPPFLGQGANQALQDAYLLANGIARINGRSTLPSDRLTDIQLKSLVRDYQRKRYFHTLQLSVKAFVLGFIETLPGLPGSYFRDSFFKVMASVGVVSLVFLDGAKPKV